VTSANEKSDRRNAACRMRKATSAVPASAYTARRPDATHSRRPDRAPYSEAPMP
jgi:hypothetical protein